MIKKCTKKFVSLLSAYALVLAASFPAMAGGDESYFIDMQTRRLHHDVSPL